MSKQVVVIDKDAKQKAEYLICFYEGKHQALNCAKMILNELRSIPKYATCGKFERKKRILAEGCY